MSTAIGPVRYGIGSRYSMRWEKTRMSVSPEASPNTGGMPGPRMTPETPGAAGAAASRFAVGEPNARTRASSRMRNWATLLMCP